LRGQGLLINIVGKKEGKVIKGSEAKFSKLRKGSRIDRTPVKSKLAE